MYILLTPLLLHRCDKPRVDAILYSYFTEKAVFVQGFLEWVGDVKYTNPNIIITPETMAKSDEYVYN